MRPLLAVLTLLVAASGVQARVLRLEPEIEVAAGADRLILRWEGVPKEAVEQEVLVSLDGGERWIEVRRLEISVREFELRLPQGVAADLLFALRTGDRERELAEVLAKPVRQTIRVGAAVPALLPAAIGRGRSQRTDGSGGGRDLPPALEPCREDGLEGLRAASPGAPWQQPSAALNGHRRDLAMPAVDASAGPLSTPLRT